MQKHLLSIDDLTKADVENIFASAESCLDGAKILSGKFVVNLFFENSTRTRASFEIAAKKLGAEVINISVANSSVSKGETLLDTVQTLDVMGPEFIVIRHGDSGVLNNIAPKVNAKIINGGDGCHEHPTQALLDAFVIREKFKSFNGLKVAICGDILHSRVARSNVKLLSMLGASVNLVGPNSLLPKSINNFVTGGNITIYNNMEQGLKDVDVVMMLRIQQERINSGLIPSNSEFFKFYGLDHKKLAFAKEKAYVMHPGPINRGVEICSKLADDTSRSLILEQVKAGVLVRAAIFSVMNNI